MGTTTLLVEIVIIGFQVLIWILLIFFTTWGYNWVDVTSLKDWSGIIAIGLVVISYTLGIIFDGIASSLSDTWFSWAYYRLPLQTVARKGVFEEYHPYDTSPSIMRSHIQATDPNTYEHLEKIFNQGRLLRSTSINLILISITSIMFVVTQMGIIWKLIIFIALVLMPLAGLSLWLWNKILDNYYNELTIAHNLWQTQNPQKKEGVEQ
jgi:hypothetical protein